jgi:hypothetical protein
VDGDSRGCRATGSNIKTDKPERKKEVSEKKTASIRQTGTSNVNGTDNSDLLEATTRSE